MDPLEWVLAFVNQISGPAKAMTASVRELTKALKELQSVSDKLKPITIPGMTHKGSKGGSGKAFSEATDGWSKAAKAAERANASILKGVTQVEREQARANAKLLQANSREAMATAKLVSQRKKAEQGYSQWWDRELSKRERASDRAMKAELRSASRAAAGAIREKERADKAMLSSTLKRIKKARAAEEKASHKWYLGGHKGMGDLAKDKIKHKVGGLAGGALDSIIGAPGQVLSGAFGAVGSVVEATASMAVNFGKMAISAQAMREEAVEGFKALYGDAEVANNLFDQARTMAKLTKFDTGDVVKIYSTLAANNFKKEELGKYAWAVADIESARKDKGKPFLNALARIASNKTASYGQVASAGLQGPGGENVWNELAKRKGITKNMSKKDWMKLFKDGSVTREEALDAVTQAVAHKYDTKTGKLGEFAKGQGDKTWSGVISNIKNGLGDVLNMRLPEDHAINKFKDILKAIGSEGGLFDETTENGKRFSALMGRFLQDLFSMFGPLSSDIDGSMKSFLSFGEAVETKFRQITDYIRDNVVPAIKDAVNSPNLDDNLSAFAAKLAEIIGRAIVIGISNALDSVIPKYLAVLAHPLDAWKPLGQAISSVRNGGRFESVNEQVDRESAERAKLRAGAPAAIAAPSDQYQSKPLMSFDTGGEVPGPYGRPQLAIVHGKERISGLGASKGNGYGASVGGSGSMGCGGPPQVNVHFHGNVGADAGDIQEAIKQATYAGYMQALEEAAAAQGVL